MTSLPSAADPLAVHRPVASLSADEPAPHAPRAQGFRGTPAGRRGVPAVPRPSPDPRSPRRYDLSAPPRWRSGGGLGSATHGVILIDAT
ncbi:hypothetical protein CLM83_07645 [Streptomyces albidoflavus]|nr:hypothetical protein CLM83_07645 [Streptomyces albidoflavus]